MNDPGTGKLSQNFTRMVLGYDRRVRPSRDQQKRSQIPWVGDWFDSIGPRVTYETLVWPSQIDYGIGSDNNGFDLVQSLEEAKGSQTTDDVYVAFDVPESRSEFLWPPRPEIACEPSFCKIVNSVSWTFMGFDVVDIRRRSSVLYSFNWGTDELLDELLSINVILNHVGIVNEINSAMKMCDLFSDITVKTRGHAPFSPCGIWISC